MTGKADLHMHTVHSDGTLTTRQLMERARGVGLSTISITDHDNTAAIGEAHVLSAEFGIDVISGVELSATINEHDVHILGYFFDHTDAALLDYLSHYRGERVKRAERIIDKLNSLKIPLRIESVLEKAGAGSVGRPHIANALLEEGLTESYHEAFFKYIGFGKPAYEKKSQVTPREAFELIAAAGGLSFIAHPGNFIDEKMLMELIKQGVDGLEVIHPSHSPERVAYYKGIANEYFLLTSGGSDFHGGRRNDADVFGKYVMSDDEVEMMRRRLVQSHHRSS
ncbi:PHP domain-containing protein [Sphingobacteriales bacterium CHB3]|nr:PHP domain-containing protein [Sphingobacteriales bacterium CHB3]